MRLLLPLFAITGLLLSPLPGQGTKDDYQRAFSLKALTDNKVFRTDIQANWLPDGKQFWYRVETGPGAHEFVLVDVVTGVRTVVADLAGLPRAPALQSAKLRIKIGPTRRTGPASLLTIVNQLDEAVEAFWVDPEGKHQSYGRIAPGAEAVQNTFAGHQWAV